MPAAGWADSIACVKYMSIADLYSVVWLQSRPFTSIMVEQAYKLQPGCMCSHSAILYCHQGLLLMLSHKTCQALLQACCSLQALLGLQVCICYTNVARCTTSAARNHTDTMRLDQLPHHLHVIAEPCTIESSPAEDSRGDS